MPRNNGVSIFLGGGAMSFVRGGTMGAGSGCTSPPPCHERKYTEKD